MCKPDQRTCTTNLLPANYRFAFPALKPPQPFQVTKTNSLLQEMPDSAEQVCPCLVLVGAGSIILSVCNGEACIPARSIRQAYAMHDVGPAGSCSL